MGKKMKLATGGLSPDLVANILQKVAAFEYTDLLKMKFSDDDIEAMRKAKFVVPPDPPIDTLCTCGHALRHHSQLSAGCYALKNFRCPCSGFKEAK